jgi:hypothetical protein
MRRGIAIAAAATFWLLMHSTAAVAQGAPGGPPRAAAAREKPFAAGPEVRFTARDRTSRQEVDPGGLVAADRAQADAASRSLGASGDYRVPLNGRVAPYLGAGLGVISGSEERRTDATGVFISPHVGVTWFVREFFSVDTNLFMSWSPEEIFVTSGRTDDYDYGLRFKLRIDF